MWYETREPRKKGGGGGKAKIRLGRTGPRGRVYAPAPKGSTVVAKSKFIKAGKGSRSAVREHLRYIQERERGENEPERKFFNRDKEGIERKDVYDSMMQGRGERAAMHTVILSPGDNSIDLQEYTRESMKALEERLGHDLDWYAITHENTDHYHAHVVIAGKIPGREHEHERQGGYGKWRDQRDISGNWSSEEKDLKEVLGHRFDEKPVLDPREERLEDSKFGSGSERAETDPRVNELIGDSSRSVSELKTEKMLDRFDRRQAAIEAGKQRGEVYLDRGDLKELRDAGNDYMARERSLDREIDRAFEREMTRDIFSLDRDREREHERDRSDDGGRSRGERGDRGDDEEKKRGRDDFDRGR
jgi:hypothetical protein